ncbi:hypothetical protein FUAX_24820 [Fulvitalea axinellae]|uniref:Uncharacterized protein n=1 Tax=Fulvitalea axinellae TaxID=1182444 RepID=A0AAU9DCB1_9BACT|nr:hypothetical protein FUAX_24820 [Fulvitalea axinellae]
MNKRKLIRYLLVVCAALLLLLVGYFRERYIFNFINPNIKGFLLPRLRPDYESYPMTLATMSQAFLRDPRWLSTLFQFISIPLATATLIYGIFGQGRYFGFTLGIYVAVVLLCVSAVAFSMLTGQYAYGYSLAQQLKNLAQLPFVAIFLIPAFRLYEMSQTQET